MIGNPSSRFPVLRKYGIHKKGRDELTFNKGSAMKLKSAVPVNAFIKRARGSSCERRQANDIFSRVRIGSGNGD